MIGELDRTIEADCYGNFLYSFVDVVGAGIAFVALWQAVGVLMGWLSRFLGRGSRNRDMSAVFDRI